MSIKKDRVILKYKIKGGFIKKVEIYESKIKNIIYLVLAIIMTLVSLSAWYTTSQQGTSLISLVSLFGIFFFGAAIIFIATKTIKSSPVITLDANGFTERTSLISPGEKISWDQVDRIEHKTMTGQEFVTVFLKDGKTYVDNLSAAKKATVNANLSLGYGEITINPGQLKDMKAKELADLMNQYLNK